MMRNSNSVTSVIDKNVMAKHVLMNHFAIARRPCVSPDKQFLWVGYSDESI